MLLDRLNLKMDHFYSSGLFLTTEEQLILQTSLPILQQENKFLSLTFLGKIFGTVNDYYIVQGRGEDFIRSKMTFYSVDGYSWRLLFLPSVDSLKCFHLVRTRFKGDPICKHKYHGGPEVEEGNKKAEIKEEDRLSAFVKLMDYETAIGPKNSLMITPKGIINQNPYFQGISKFDALKLESYLHYRLPDSDIGFVPTTLICPPGGDRPLQFMEPISKDYPPGTWTLQADSLEEVVTIRNLWWPGYRFYFIPETGEYNSLYMGYGERNDDLPFMILDK
ncbi:radial spoke head protein 9 homolog [Caerostris darwini]|uniref:Radial spoke head protein 9 homolog n=1 Tax=Caerostris darwini TaxID=1538125 RepID=A0AAV4WRC7_9ARAC|nr:radial spoke head protein 9 homolog [Caerostris darwini]